MLACRMMLARSLGIRVSQTSIVDLRLLIPAMEIPLRYEVVCMKMRTWSHTHRAGRLRAASGFYLSIWVWLKNLGGSTLSSSRCVQPMTRMLIRRPAKTRCARVYVWGITIRRERWWRRVGTWGVVLSKDGSMVSEYPCVGKCRLSDAGTRRIK